ncbi:hypothetical protein [Chryseobacterium indoltheticum]|uniref:hypothetical protein n=1 Tax=Chryseobacterium indoltheticum TaxID=254 RepID=UPI003F4985D6
MFRNQIIFSSLAWSRSSTIKSVRQLKTNKILRNMLENEQTRAAFIEALKDVAQELEK